MRVELPAGQWAEIKSPDDLTGGDLLAVERSIKMDTDGKRANITAAVGAERRTGLLARIITGWSLDLPLPNGDPSVLEQVPLRTFRVLLKSVDEHMKQVNDDEAPNTPRSSD